MAIPSSHTNEINELLRKFHDGNISSEEYAQLSEKMKTTSDMELYKELEEHWNTFEEYKQLSDEKIDSLYNHGIKPQLDIPQKKSTIIRFKRYWLQIAASLLILLIGGIASKFYTEHQVAYQLAEQQITIEAGETGISAVTLPDGTKVRLNAKSTLSYRQDFGQKDRKVSLSGEGYFEVKRDESKRFVVTTEVMDIAVLGTSFNIRVYSPDNAHVTLLEGSIKVSDTHHTKELLIKPGQNATLQKGGTFSIHEVQAKEYSTWAEGQFYFDDTELIEIMRELGRWYNVNIIFTSKEAMHYRMHFQSDRGDSLPQVLNLLNSMQKVNAKFENDKVIVGL